jgi:putative DNA primase/helicase
MNKIKESDIRKCYRFLSHDVQTEIRLIHPTMKLPPRSIFVNNEEDFVKECVKYNEKYNIYAGINERLINGTSKSEVVSLKTIVIDIDAPRASGFEKESATDEERKLAESDTDDIMNGLAKVISKTPVKVSSGNGYQLWFAVSKQHIDDDNRDEVERQSQAFQDLVKRRFQKKAVIDKIGDLPRIIKVWGTLNIKGKNTSERPYRVCTLDNDCVRQVDKKLWGQIEQIGDIEKKEEKIEIGHITEIKNEFLPEPMKYLLNDYQHKTSENWMRIIETLSTFLRGIGLSKDKVIAKIIEWCRKQPHRENGEELEAQSIVERIFANEINCPNFDKLLKKEEGYPFFGLKNVFRNAVFTEEFENYKNPVKYYKVHEDRSKLSEIEKIKADVNELVIAKKKSEVTEMLVNFIKTKHKVYTTRDDIKSEIWVYEDGIYVPNGKSYIKELTREVMEEKFSRYYLTEVIDKIEADTLINQECFFNKDNANEIAVKNGILNIRTRTLEEFNPEKVFFNKINSNYNPEAKCPNICKFFEEILKNKEDVNLMFEIIGFCLLKDYMFEKSFMFVGNGRNGKSKALSLIKHFLSPENCASIPLSQLIPTSTSVAELHNKMVNLAGDLSNYDLRDTGMFKQLTGRDLITAKRKYLRDLFFTNHSKLVFACNELPRVYDTSHGFWERWILLEFPFHFVKQEVYDKLDTQEQSKSKIIDEDILSSLLSPQELSGLLNCVLDGLDRLLQTRGFSYTKSMKEIKDLWIRKSDSFTAFCMDLIVEDVEGYITKKELRKTFSKYCKKHKVKGVGDKAIKAVLQDMHGVEESKKSLEFGNWERVWEGIAWK